MLGWSFLRRPHPPGRHARLRRRGGTTVAIIFPHRRTDRRRLAQRRRYQIPRYLSLPLRSQRQPDIQYHHRSRHVFSHVVCRRGDTTAQGIRALSNVAGGRVRRHGAPARTRRGAGTDLSAGVTATHRAMSFHRHCIGDNRSPGDSVNAIRPQLTRSPYRPDHRLGDSDQRYSELDAAGLAYRHDRCNEMPDRTDNTIPHFPDHF